MKCVVSCSACPLSVKMEPCRYSATHIHTHKWTHRVVFHSYLDPDSEVDPQPCKGDLPMISLNYWQFVLLYSKNHLPSPPSPPSLSASPLGPTGNLCSERCYSDIPELWEQVSATHSQPSSCTVRKSSSSFHFVHFTCFVMLNRSLISLNSTPQKDKVKTESETFLEIS